MTDPGAEFDVAIVGGGMAGLMAAIRAEEAGASVALVDAGIPGVGAELGGFAPFSGAKFSTFPAGRGLVPLVGSDAALVDRYKQLCAGYAALGFPQFELTQQQLVGEHTSANAELEYRRYHSVLLSPMEMKRFLGVLGQKLGKAKIFKGVVTEMMIEHGPPFRICLADGTSIEARALVMAAGRLGANLMLSGGLPETEGKGIDVGVRLEFDETESLAPLRALGPDAKFMAGGVRTFCLNSPGRIFHYAGAGFLLPGGVVAEPGWNSSNVGVLWRNKDRVGTLERLRAHSARSRKSALFQIGRGSDLGWTDESRAILGPAVTEIDAFITQLVHSGLVKLPPRYIVHYPLLDWHWPVFALPTRLSSAIPGVLAAGDVSGHARGLLQASLMGILAVEEALI